MQDCGVGGEHPVTGPAGQGALEIGFEADGARRANVLTLVHPSAVLLGGLRRDHIIDLATNRLTVSDGELTSEGFVQPLEFFMGVPMLKANIGGTSQGLFFDTGAQISYFQGTPPADAVDAEDLEDFFPMVGAFRTQTKQIKIGLNGLSPTLRCGKLPGMMGMSLSMANVSGILGNEVMRNRVTAFYPRRRQLVLQA